MEKYQKIKNFNIPSNIIKVVNWKTGGFIETPLPKCFWCEIHWRFFTVYKCRRSGSALEFGYGFTHQGQTWHGFSWLIDCPSSSFLLFISGMWARLNLVWPFPTCDWSPCDKISDPAVGIFRIIGSNLQNPRSQYRSNVVQHPIQWGKFMSLAPISRDFSLSLSLQNDIPNLFSFQPLRSVVVDHAEESCYVGSHEGKIYRIDLLDPSRSVKQMVDETASRKMFLGHEKAVTCLSVSTGGCHLLSGERKTQTRSMMKNSISNSIFSLHFY